MLRIAATYKPRRARAGGLLTAFALPRGTISQARRRRQIWRLAGLALRVAGEGRSLSPVLWLFVLGLAALMGQAGERGWTLIPALGLFAALICAALFDALYLILPTRQLAVAAGCGVVLLAGEDAETALAHAMAAIGAFAALRLLAWGYESWRGKPGLGGGDARLFGIAGLVLGLEGLPGCLLIAVASALASLAIERRGAGFPDSDHAIPFGPHLALGLWLGFVFGTSNSF
jgi:leader peptidase (prepilin peptidase)/N-methyltransferase